MSAPLGGLAKGTERYLHRRASTCKGRRLLGSARALVRQRRRRWEVTMFGMEMLICEMMMVALHDMNMDMANYVSTNTCAPVTCEI